MSQSGNALVLATVVRDLATRARRVADFLIGPGDRTRLLDCAEGLEQEAARLEAEAMEAAVSVVPQDSGSAPRHAP